MKEIQLLAPAVLALKSPTLLFNTSCLLSSHEGVYTDLGKSPRKLFSSVRYQCL